MLLSAFVLAFGLTLALSLPADTVTAQRCALHSGDNPMPLTVKNASARLIHLNLGNSVVIALAPLEERKFDGVEADAAQAVLDGPLAGLVEAGELVVDGKPKAAPPSNEPIGAKPTPPTPPNPLDPDAERNTDPLPPSAQHSPAAPAAPDIGSSAGATAKRRT